MKIAVAALLTRAISPETFGGTEGFTYALVEHLVRRGHEVTLYASSDSRTSARLVSSAPSSVTCTESLGANLAQPYSLLSARQLAMDADQYDIIHNNFFHTYILSAFAPFITTPMVHTVHNVYYSDKDWRKALKLFGYRSHEHTVFVSRQAMHLAGPVPHSHVIYNGIDVNHYGYNAHPESELLWLGRMVPEKGAADAVSAAEAAGARLTLATALSSHGQQRYFDETIKPRLTPTITLTHQQASDDRIEFYRQARALLFPIAWEEPFGLVMIEAMACGTPVIAYARGAATEIIQDGITGFLVNSSDTDIRGDFIIKETGLAGLRAAILRLRAMKLADYAQMRQACRHLVETRFTLDRMVDNYEALYTEIR